MLHSSEVELGVSITMGSLTAPSSIERSILACPDPKSSTPVFGRGFSDV